MLGGKECKNIPFSTQLLCRSLKRDTEGATDAGLVIVGDRSMVSISGCRRSEMASN